ISPISNTVAILVSGLSAASLSFLASKRGQYNNIGKRLTKDGTSVWLSLEAFLSSESFLLTLICSDGLSSPFSGNLGSSCSTTMCFFSRVHPLSLPFRPFPFSAALGSADELVVSAFSVFLSVEDAVDVIDSVEGLTPGASVGAASLFAVVFTGLLSFSTISVTFSLCCISEFKLTFTRGEEELVGPLLSFRHGIVFSAALCVCTSPALGVGIGASE
uniref:Uncharacterized protein n=1 Tax=Mola mola TaxID=94237 RepID=A0A3Q3W5C9_MOLML